VHQAWTRTARAGPKGWSRHFLGSGLTHQPCLPAKQQEERKMEVHKAWEVPKPALYGGQAVPPGMNPTHPQAVRHTPQGREEARQSLAAGGGRTPLHPQRAAGQGHHRHSGSLRAVLCTTILAAALPPRAALFWRAAGQAARPVQQENAPAQRDQLRVWVWVDQPVFPALTCRLPSLGLGPAPRAVR